MGVTRVTISHLGYQGDGVSRDGRLFVDRAAPGDELQVSTYRDSTGVSRADISKIIKPSPFRQKAPCTFYDVCGNCSLQHLTERFYREWKTGLVKEILLDQKIYPKHWLPPVFIGSQNRRRITFTAKKQKHQIVLGYYRRRTQYVENISSCLIAEPAFFELRKSLIPLLKKVLSEGEMVDIFLQKVENGIDMVLTGNLPREATPLLKSWCKGTVIKRVSCKARNSEKLKVLVSAGSLNATFGKVKVRLPPASFLQPTVEGEKALVDSVLSFLPDRGKFADLFSGCGTFTGALLEKGEVDAYESSVLAVSALTESTTSKALKVFRRDLFTRPLRREELNRYDAVIFDPPRAGCEAQAIAMASSKVKTLIGVSCNPLTFARDARLLGRGGYKLQSIRIIDQFLWSHHVEVVGFFSR